MPQLCSELNYVAIDHALRVLGGAGLDRAVLSHQAIFAVTHQIYYAQNDSVVSPKQRPVVFDQRVALDQGLRALVYALEGLMECVLNKAILGSSSCKTSSRAVLSPQYQQAVSSTSGMAFSGKHGAARNESSALTG
ncbi:hypothetical protein RRG08_002785 [Elysia crispata]|uniref:Uncharacterized protein n=1 Tax=Elysia crispata TaxID=231223 RepID=A0AAE0XU88_9GAST|nr:hypothetical protein RRG08_002785 [Elysia crispata]